MKTYVVEHKTSSRDIGLGSKYWKRLTLDAQISFYLVGARALGHEPDGVLYDVVRKVALAPYQATPIEDRKYKQEKSRACPECKKKKPATAAPHQIEVEETEDSPARTLECKDGRIVTEPGGELYANQRERDETPDEFRARVRLEIASNPDKYFQRGKVYRLESEENASAQDAWGLAEQIRSSRRLDNWPRNVNACDSNNSECEYWSVCTNETVITDPTRFVHQPPQKVTRLPVISASSASTYRSCPRKYYFAYELRVRSIEKAHALRFGTLFHIGLETWWTTVDLEASLDAMRAKYREQQIDQFDAIKAEELLTAYHVRWREERLDVLAVEKEFEAPLLNPETGHASKTFQRGGKVDALVREVDEDKTEAAE